MAIPTSKSPQIESILDSMLPPGHTRKADIEANICVDCHKSATVFNDALSEKEYTISGLCQSCQDEVFG
uniref:Uncharacterized protein n=1 Tax=viral metagenome TaxID=1070528 RepID=A0A6H2A484_9ZZZZ